MTSLTNNESDSYDLEVINEVLNNIRLDKNTNKIVLSDLFKIFQLCSKKAKNATNYYKRLIKKFPNLFTNIELLYVNGTGHKTRVIDIPSAIEIIWILPGNFAEIFRRKSASYLTRLMAGDRTLINVVEIQHERVSPQTREIMLTHVETPALPQVSVIELQNIIERQTVTLNANKEQLTTARLTITDLTKKNINLEKKVDKTIQFSKEWQSNCEFKLQMRMRPGDKLAQTLSSELVNYMHREHDQKVDELDSRSRDEVVEQLNNDLMVSNIAIDKFSKQHNKDLPSILKEVTKEIENKLKMTFEDDMDCYVDKLKSNEDEFLRYKKNTIMLQKEVDDLKNKLNEIPELNNIISGLQTTIKKLKRDKENAEEEYAKLNVQYKEKNKKDKIIDVQTVQEQELKAKEAHARRVELFERILMQD